MRQALPLLGVLAVLAAGPARAGGQDFTLVNRTGAQIDEVYVSRAASRTWGKDIMGSGSLKEDACVDITLDASGKACRWDLKVTSDDGDTAEWDGLDLCGIGTVTLYWDRKRGTTRAVTR